MKKRLILIFAAMCCLLPFLLPVFWKNHVSLPVLVIFNSIGSALPFSLLEWGGAVFMLVLIAGFSMTCRKTHPVHAAVRLAKQLACAFLSVIFLLFTLWMPLYAPAYKPVYASSQQLKACAETLIDHINASPPDFSLMPDDLPAKFAAFPFWMRSLNISGFYSFFTGEALVSPDLPAPALPFVAVHEAMHGQGIASEGLCNIAAYKECMQRGGLYADSARLWALRYVAGELRQTDYSAYSDCFRRMQPETYHLFMQTGGTYSKAGAGNAPYVFPASGTRSGYEILAHWLAAEMHG